MLVLSLSVLTACGDSTIIEAPKPVIPEELMNRSFVPTQLPDMALDQAEVERYWGTDRINLILCENTRESLVGILEEL